MVIELGNGFHFRPARDFVPDTYGNRPPSDGRDLIFAYPEPDESSSYSTQFEGAFVEKVYERVRHRVPSLADSTVVAEKCRAGLYENTPDHHAIVGACEVDGLYLANGFSGHGVMHSPATGRAISDILIDGQSEVVDIDSLGIDRFDRGELIEETAFI
jgi:sarcosine oxidase subunit beta